MTIYEERRFLNCLLSTYKHQKMQNKTFSCVNKYTSLCLVRRLLSVFFLLK